MATKTRFDDDELRQIVVSHDLGTFDHAEPIAAGTIQTNYVLHTTRADGTRAKLVFRYYESRSLESVRFETDLLAYLTARAYPCPAPLANRAGTFTGVYRDKPYVIFEFLEGYTIAHPDLRQRQQLIQKAAELHILTRDFHSPYTPYRWNYAPDLCLMLAQGAAERLGTPGARAKLAWLADQLGALDLPPDHPKGVCHCDFHVSNILWRDGNFAALLDFDDANVTYLTFDLVVLIESYAWPHPRETLDLTQARSVAQAYATYRPLAEIERRHLFDVYSLGILFDCVWFFARGDAGDFYEKRKIDALTGIGRQRFLDALFGS